MKPSGKAVKGLINMTCKVYGHKIILPRIIPETNKLSCARCKKQFGITRAGGQARRKKNG